MYMKKIELWELRAKTTRAKLESRDAHLDLLPHVSSYMRAIEILLSHTTASELCALKTDLWNEGVETNRDILGRLELCQRLRIVGVDVSNVTCQLARKHLQNTFIANADIRHLPFKNESFDTIFDLSTIDHVLPSEMPVVLGEYQRTLKGPGLLLLFFWYQGELFRVFRMLRKPSRYKTAPYLYYLPINLVESALRKNGFDVIAKYCTVGLGGEALDDLSSTGKRSRKLAGLIYTVYVRVVYSKWSQILLRPLGGMFIVMARKRRLQHGV